MQTFIRKITSRKFIVAVVGIVVGLAAAFGIEENEYAQIVGLIGSIVAAISYIAGEAKVDAAGAAKPSTPELKEPESKEPESKEPEFKPEQPEDDDMEYFG